MKLPGRCSAWTIPVSALATMCVLSDLLGAADAHGFLYAPKVEFRSNQEDPTAYSATIDGATALPEPAGMHFGWGPTLAAEAFSVAFSNSTYTSLREFVMQHQTMQPSTAISPECGRTKEDASVLQALPDEVVWQHGDNEGFTLSHEGPCEVWCDNERVFADKNCAKTFPDVPAKLPYERAKCVGKKRLQMVWLALHEGTRWQVYMNCAPLVGADAASSKKLSSSPTVVTPRLPTSNFSAGTVSPSAEIHDKPTITPTMKTSWPSPGSNDSSHGAVDHHSSVRPRTSTVSTPTTQAPALVHPAGQDATAASGTNWVGNAVHKPIQTLPLSPSLRPRPLTTFPPRRASETDDKDEDEDEDADGLTGDDKIIESHNEYAEKAMGPVPEEVYKEARKDFEEEHKRKEQRRAALKKEFGYA